MFLLGLLRLNFGKQLLTFLLCNRFRAFANRCDLQWSSLFRALIHLLILSRLSKTKRAIRYFEWQMGHFYCTFHPATDSSKRIDWFGSIVGPR
jgi:hypothetical protein